MNDAFDLDTVTAIAAVKSGSELGAFMSTRLGDAEEESRRLAASRPWSPLHGVPFSLKDEWETLCLPTTAGSYRHRHRRSEVDSAVLRVFRDAGAVLIGKTNLSDLGLAPESTNYLQTTRNPHDATRTAGGSSGGAAAAVAAGMSAFDWGTDIGGSIRMPAAFCGVVGMRLSSQTWPITELFPIVPRPLAWMCGQGPITRRIDQMRLVLDVAAPALRRGDAGRWRDFAARRCVVWSPENLGRWPGFSEEVTARLSAVVDTTALVSTHGLPPARYMRDVYASLWASHLRALVSADPSLTFAGALRGVLSATVLRGRFGDRRFHPTTAELLALMGLGKVTLFHSRRRAIIRATRIRERFHELWDRGTVVVAPVCCYPAPILGRSNRNSDLITCTIPGNLADATGLEIPFGDFAGLPRGIQLMGPPGSERALLDLAESIVGAG